MGEIRVTEESGVWDVQIHRPEKKNALTRAMYEALAAVVERAGTPDRGARVIVFRGVEGAFSAGNDLSDFLEHEIDGEAPAPRFLYALAKSRVPMVAAVDGVAVGIGTTLLFHCDFVFASNRSFFALPFVDLSLVPEAASSVLLPRLCGHLNASKLLMLGEPFDASAALAYGIVGEVCEPAELESKATEIAKKLAAKPRRALQETKALLRMEREGISDRIGREIEIFSELLESDAAREAMSAFLEKRPPDRSKYD
ncbi:MAG: enoyl-CoA hydratase [Planctomycetota bacterium]